MLHCSLPVSMRVICLTMLPDGGAMTPALKTLGYRPYSLRTTFQQGNARTHPIEWSQALDRKKRLNTALFVDYDCFVGPPAALLYDAILRDGPSYTKVILVEEPDKARWAIAYDEYLARLQWAMARTSRNKISVNFRNMLEKMVVRGDVGRTAVAGNHLDKASAPGDKGGRDPGSVRGYSYARSVAGVMRTPSSAALDSAVHAETELAKAHLAQTRGGSSSNSESNHTSCKCSLGSKSMSSGPVFGGLITKAGELAAASTAKPPADSEPRTTATDTRVAKRMEGDRLEVDEGLEVTPVTPRAVALERFEESVKMSVPAHRLLVYRYGDGWEALCAFLDRPVPSEPFPPYDDGLRVLGFLQERIQWAESVMYVLLAMTAVTVLVNVWPYMGSVRQYASELYQDYQLAFGEDGGEAGSGNGTSEAAARKQRAGSEDFEDAWRKRGGIVTVNEKKST